MRASVERPSKLTKISTFIVAHFGGAGASVVSKAKVADVQQLDSKLYLVSFKDQTLVGREPLRPVEQGERSYLAPSVDC